MPDADNNCVWPAHAAPRHLPCCRHALTCGRRVPKSASVQQLEAAGRRLSSTLTPADSYGFIFRAHPRRVGAGGEQEAAVRRQLEPLAGARKSQVLHQLDAARVVGVALCCSRLLLGQPCRQRLGARDAVHLRRHGSMRIGLWNAVERLFARVCCPPSQRATPTAPRRRRRCGAPQARLRCCRLSGSSISQLAHLKIFCVSDQAHSCLFCQARGLVPAAGGGSGAEGWAENSCARRHPIPAFREGDEPNARACIGVGQAPCGCARDATGVPVRRTTAARIRHNTA